MVNKDIRYIKIGVFVIAGLVVAMFMIFMIGSDKSLFERQYTLKSSFGTISGLRVGAAVQLAGINVGMVDRIRFPKDIGEKKILIQMKVAKKYQERIREDSRATISTQGLLGDKFILLSMGSPDQPAIPDDGYIQSEEVTGLFDLAEKGGEIIKDFQKVAKSVTGILDNFSGGEGNVNKSLASVRRIIKQVETGRGLIHELIYDPKGQKIISNISSSMASLSHLLGTAESGDDGSRIKQITKNINIASANLKNITEKIDKGQGTIGALIADPSIYNDIRNIFGKADRNLLFKAVIRATIAENEKQVLK